MAQKIKNVRAEVNVTADDNEEYFGGKLPTKWHGFCFITRTVYGIERSGNTYTGLIARRGKSALKVSSSNLTDWDIDTQKEQPMTLPDHPLQPPEDEKRNACPECGTEAVSIGDRFKCLSIFCQAEFTETGTGPELASGTFEVGQEFEVYWMEGQREMHATIGILPWLGNHMRVKNSVEVEVEDEVEVYRRGQAEAFRNPMDERAWIYPWNKKELHIKCGVLQMRALKVQVSNTAWPIRITPDRIKHMAARPYSHVIGQLAAMVERKLQDDSGYDEVVFYGGKVDE